MAVTFRDAFRAERPTTNGHRPPRTPALVVLARAAALIVGRWGQLRRVALSVTAFVLITAAAFTVATGLGLLAAGLSLLVLEALSGTDESGP